MYIRDQENNSRSFAALKGVEIGQLPRPLAFSKAVRGRLQKTSQGLRSFEIVGGIQDGQTANGLQLQNHLPEADVLQSLTDREFGAFNILFPQVTQILIGNKAEGYTEGIGSYDVEGLVNASTYLTKQTIQKKRQPEESVVFRTIFGATEEMPLRGLSYLLPALVRMQDFADHGIAIPQFQIVFANHLGAKLNGLRETNVKEQARQFARLARAYIAEFFPDIANDVVFLEDTPLERGAALERDLGRLAKDSEKTFIQRPDLLVRLNEKGNAHGSTLATSYYAAAHILLHDTDARSYTLPLFTDQVTPVTPGVVISIGGKQEEVFYEYRFAAKTGHSDQSFPLSTGQLFTRHHVPPYYMASSGDRALEDSISQYPRAAQEDLDYLAEITEQRAEKRELETDLESFLRQYSQNKEGR